MFLERSKYLAKPGLPSRWTLRGIPKRISPLNGVVRNMTQGLGFDEWLSRTLAGRPALPFNKIVHGAMEELGLSRATVARRLARMVEDGYLVRSPEGSYTLPGQASGEADAPAAVVEVIHSDATVVIDPFGGLRIEFSSTLRILSGFLSKYWLSVASIDPPDGEQFQYASSNFPTRLCRGGFQFTPPGVLAHYLEFAEPIGSKERRPIHYVFGQTFPPTERMYQGAPLPESLVGEQGAEAEEMIATEVVSRPIPGLIKQVGPHSSLGIRIHFPHRFPKGTVRVLVSDGRSGIENSKEKSRIDQLAEEKGTFGGLRAFGDMLLLQVPSFKLDTNYVVQWSLPTEKAYRAWLHTFSKT